MNLEYKMIREIQGNTLNKLGKDMLKVKLLKKYEGMIVKTLKPVLRIDNSYSFDDLKTEGYLVLEQTIKAVKLNRVNNKDTFFFGTSYKRYLEAHKNKFYAKKRNIDYINESDLMFKNESEDQFFNVYKPKKRFSIPQRTYNKMLRSFDNRYKQIFELRSSGLTVRQIADKMECRPSNVVFYTNKMKEKLTENLHSNMNGELIYD